MEADLDHRRGIEDPIIGNLLCEKRAVGEHGHQKAILLGIGVNLKKILPRQRLAAGQAEGEAPFLLDFIHDADDLGKAQFLLNPPRVVEAVRVAHHATQITAAGQLPLAAQREAATGESLRESLAVLPIRNAWDTAHDRSRGSLATAGTSSTISRLTNSFTNRSTSFSAVFRSTSKLW